MSLQSITLVSVLALFAVGCGCYTNDSGVAVSASKYAAERDAACEAVTALMGEPCDAEWLATVRVYESPLAQIPELCNDGPTTRGCFCHGPGCASIILPSDVTPSELRSVAIHEFTHASLRSIDVDSDDHSAYTFWPVWRHAAALLE